jgi:hypothetical protein
MGCREIPFKFSQGLEFKNQGIFIFSDWIQSGINSNKHFEGFSNLELFKISLNIQIQTKAKTEAF